MIILLFLKKRQTSVFTFLAITILLAIIVTFSMTPNIRPHLRSLLKKIMEIIILKEHIPTDGMIRNFSILNLKSFQVQMLLKESFVNCSSILNTRTIFSKKINQPFVFVKSLKQKIVDFFKVFSSQDSKIPGEDGE